MREPLTRLVARVAVVLLSVTAVMASPAARGDTSADKSPSYSFLPAPAAGAGSAATSSPDPGGLSPGGRNTRAPAIGGTSTCPTESAVWSELRTLLPNEVLAARVVPEPGVAPLVQVDDLGASYSVLAAGRRREYRDETRDCAHRARVAALFIALTIEPPLPSAAAPPPAALGGRTPASESDARPQLVRLDLGATGHAGWGPDGRIVEAGVAVRAAMGAGAWRLVLGGAALLPRDVTINALRLRHWRLPFDIGLRAQFGGEAVAPYLEAGLAVALLAERGRDLASNQTQLGLELGGFASAGLRFFPSARFAPFVNLRVEAVPAPPAIEALPRGVVGHTPVIWVGVTAGLSIDL